MCFGQNQTESIQNTVKLEFVLPIRLLLIKSN